MKLDNFVSFGRPQSGPPLMTMLDVSMRGSRKFFSGGSNFDYIFLVDVGREGPNTTISGPSSAR